MAAADAILNWLDLAGLSIGDIAVTKPPGLVWLVWGSNGENLVRAEGRTKDEAWQNAEMQALGLGILSCWCSSRWLNQRLAPDSSAG